MSRVRPMLSRPSSMTHSLDEADRIARDYDESACKFCERYKNSGLSKSSRLLLDLIVEEGVQDRSILELGCGAGGFSLEALKRGGGRAFGVDLSPKMTETANQLSAATGFEGRAKFETGNAATATLPDSNIVVMDKVICCYSDVGSLLRNATDASRNLLGLVVPRNEGIVKWPFRLGVWVMNLFQKRRGGTLFYLHRLDVLDRALRESGFTRLRRRGSRFWLVFLYKRAQARAGETWLRGSVFES